MLTALTSASPTSSAVRWPGYPDGRGVLYASGTWGSGTLTLTFCETESGTFVPIGSGVSLTANGCTGFELPAGWLKATLSGSTGATVSWNVAQTRPKA